MSIINKPKNKPYLKIIVFILSFLLVFQTLPIGPWMAFADDTKAEAREKAITWLEQNQNLNGSWGSELEITETAEVLICVPIFSQLSIRERGVSWIKNQNYQNYDDLFRKSAITEIRQETGAETIVNAQNSDGGWGLSQDYRSDVLDTILALEALMTVSLDSPNAARDATSYLMNSQNSDGGWSYVIEGESNTYLTAHVMLALETFKAVSKQQNDAVEAALSNGAKYLKSAVKPDNTWGLEADNIKYTLFAAEALRNTEPDIFNSAINKLIGVMQADGSLFQSPFLTARLARLLNLPDEIPVIPVSIIKDIEITPSDGIISYTEMTFNPILEGFYENSMALSVWVETPDKNLIPLQRDSGRYFWNTGISKPDSYSVIALIYDKDDGKYIDIMRKPFTINPSFSLVDGMITLTPGYYRQGAMDGVKIGVTVFTESNSEEILSAKLEITDEAEKQSFIKHNSTFLAGGSAAGSSTGGIETTTVYLTTFKPPTDELLKYPITVVLERKNGDILRLQKNLEVFPPIPNADVELSWELSADALMPGDDDITLTFKTKGVGNIPDIIPEKTFAGYDDFEDGDKINVVVTPDGSVKLNESTQAFNYIWVPNSTKGTVLKINTDTNEFLGEYWTSPQGQPRNPSRTTVDHDGNVWVTNRDGNSVTKIGLVENGGWIDKNGDGVPNTTQGYGDIKPWTNAGNADTNGGASTAEDECILNYVRVSSSGTRHLSIDKDNNVWVSGTGNRIFNLVDSETGSILRTEGPVGYGGYGGLIDSNGVIWSTTNGSLLRWDTKNPLNGPAGINWSLMENAGSAYGLGIDKQSNVWASKNGVNQVVKYSSDGTFIGAYAQGSASAQGIAVSPYTDDVWIAHSSSQSVGHLKNDGTYVGTIGTAQGIRGVTRGVAVDAKGFIWVTTASGYIHKIDPEGGSLGNDGETTIGAVVWTSQQLRGVNDAGIADLYTYSDMTGSTLTAPPNRGTWSGIYDSGETATEWGRASWSAKISADGAVEVYASSSANGRDFSSPVKAENGEVFDVPPGRYVKIDVRLIRSADGLSPELNEITVQARTIVAKDVKLYVTLPGDVIGVTDTDFTPTPTEHIAGAANDAALRWDEASVVIDRDRFYTLDFHGKDLEADSEFLLAKDIKLTFIDTTGALITKETGPVWVSVNPYRVRTRTFTDRPFYGAEADAKISCEIESLIQPAKELKAVLDVVDNSDLLLSVLDDEIIVPVDEQKIFDEYIWNTGLTLSGDYAARIRVYDGETPVAFGRAPFKIIAEGGFSNSLKSDREFYYRDMSAVLHDVVLNNYRNYYPGRITDTITVTDSAGNIVFESVTDLGNMYDPSKDVVAIWKIENVMPGKYNVRAVVREEGVGVAFSECQIRVSSRYEGDWIISGSLDIPKKLLTIGEEAVIRYSLENKGIEKISSIEATVTVLKYNNPDAVHTVSEVYTLPVGAAIGGNANVPANKLEVGEYLAIYTAEAEGEIYPLQSSGFTVSNSTGNPGQRPSDTVTIADVTPPLTGGENTYIIECVDKDTLNDDNPNIFYTTTAKWNSAPVVYVFAPKIAGWILAEGEAEFKEFNRDNLPSIVRFLYVKDTAGRHERYLNGYPDGTIRADAPVTRAEAAAMMHRLIHDPNNLLTINTGNLPFNDVAEHWALDDIAFVYQLGLMEGYGDSTFKPNGYISREELIKVLVLYGNLQPQELTKTNSGGWSEDYVDNAISNGYIQGFEDKSLRLKENMTRAQAMTMLNRLLNRKFDEARLAEQNLKFKDIANNHWAFGEVVEGALPHNYKRAEDGSEILVSLSDDFPNSSQQVLSGYMASAPAYKSLPYVSIDSKNTDLKIISGLNGEIGTKVHYRADKMTVFDIINTQTRPTFPTPLWNPGPAPPLALATDLPKETDSIITALWSPSPAPPLALATDLPKETDSIITANMVLSADLQNLTASMGLPELYEFVKNSIKPELYHGPSKSAQETYTSRQGNDYDTATMLISLLRHKGIPARYRYGVVTLSTEQIKGLTGINNADEAVKALAAAGLYMNVITAQGAIAGVQIERAWAEAYIPYDNYRGAGAVSGQNIWAPLDAGLKKLDGSANIVWENLGLLPASLPYVVNTKLVKLSDMDVDSNTFPEIIYDIPFSMNIGEKYQCSVEATDEAGIVSLTVSLNGTAVTLDAFGRFEFRALAEGLYVFEIKAVNTAGNYKTVTHTLIVGDESETTMPELEARLATIGNNDPTTIEGNAITGGVGDPIGVYVKARDESGTVFVDVKVNDITIEKEDKLSLWEEEIYIFTPDKTGLYEVVVTATSPSGGYIQKIFTLTLASNGIVSYPSLDISVDPGDDPGLGKVVTVYVIATDSGGGLVAVQASVDGESLAGGNGVYIFTPDHYGAYNIQATATNEAGNTTQGSVIFTLTEGGIIQRKPPTISAVIESNGPVTVGKPFAVLVSAYDESGDVTVNVTIDGTNINAVQGVADRYEFTPDTVKTYEVKATAENPWGLKASVTLAVTAGPAEGGGTVTFPYLNVQYYDDVIHVYETMELFIEASDASGQVTVTATVSGKDEQGADIAAETLAIENGKALFTPKIAGNYIIQVKATNPSGGNALATANVKAIPWPTDQLLYLIVNGGNEKSYLGDTVLVQVAGNGFVQDSLSLTVNGENLSLDSGNKTLYTPEKAGLYDFAATAKNRDEQTLNAKAILLVLDPNSTGEPPAVEITSPKDADEITAPTDIIGTASGDNLAYYELSYAEASSKDFTVFERGGDQVIDEKLGQFDPTMLNNGYYTIRLSAYNADGTGMQCEITVNVQGAMKIGNFSIAFNDMSFPVRNFPMTVIRSYDSRDKNKPGDFGYGWSLLLSGAKLSKSGVMGDNWSEVRTGSAGFYTYNLVATSPHEITVDWGNGAKEVFIAKPSPESSFVYPLNARDFTMSFVPQGNQTTSKLEAVGGNPIMLFNSGALVDIDNDLRPYNPQRFRLTTEDGTIYVFDENGNVESIKDTLGDIITINKNGIHHSDGQSIVFARDNMNRITKITGPTGKTVYYKYDAAGDLVEVIDITDESTHFTYDRSHYLTDIYDPRGVRAARVEYDDAGRMIAIVDADGNRIEINNDIAGRQQIITDRLGNPTIYVYDSRGNILSQTDALGNTTYYEYDQYGNHSSETDALGNKTSFVYTPDGKLLSKTDAVGIKVSNTYNTQGLVTSVANMDVTQLIISYDSKGNPTVVEGADGSKTNYDFDSNGQMTGVTDAIGKFISVTYNNAGNATSVTRGDGSSASFTYDADGNCTGKTETRMGANGLETLTDTYTYDKAGNLVKTIRADGSIISSEYNNIGKLAAATDEKGRRTTYSYDMFGNLERISYSDGTFETFVYDAEGRNTSATDRLGREAKMTYDAVGNLKSKTYANGATDTYVYDKKYRLIELTGVNGGTTKYEYDAADRNTAVIDALNNRTEYTYDSKSQMTGMKDANNNIFTYEYDANGNRTKIIMPDNTSVISRYDVRNRLVSQTDQNGYVTAYAYDGADRLKSVTDAEGGVWNYAYDATGNLISIKDAKNNETRFEYDKAGRVIKTTNAAGKVSSATYDESGCLQAYTDFGGQLTTYTYDKDDRLISKVSGTIRVDYTYTKDGKLETASDATGITRYTYDEMDGLTKVEYPGGLYIQYTYDEALRLTGLQTDYGSVKYEYDRLDRMTSAEDSNGKTTYHYDANGNRTMVTYPNGISMVYEYDTLNRLVKEEVKNNANETITFYLYTVGKFGERLKTEEPDRTITYTYDKLYRLTGETIVSNGNTTDMRYTYDAVSNRSSKTVDGVATIYSYNELNQLISETGITYNYDDAGNLISQSGDGKNTVYEYDALNRLIKANISQGAGAITETYKYDFAGNRIEKTTNNVTTRYLVDTNTTYAQVIAELDGTGAIKAFYTRGTELISRTAGSSASYYIYDGHGDTRMLLDKNRAITDTYAFDAWGNLLASTGTTDNPFLYCGEQFDAATGLYYLRARYMNPSTGTFISMDTYQGSTFDPASLHKYLYASANPVMYVDPSGNMTLADVLSTITINAIISATIFASVSFIKEYSKSGNIGKAIFNAATTFTVVLLADMAFYGLVKFIGPSILVGGEITLAKGYAYFYYPFIAGILSALKYRIDYLAGIWFWGEDGEMNEEGLKNVFVSSAIATPFVIITTPEKGKWYLIIPHLFLAIYLECINDKPESRPSTIGFNRVGFGHH